MRRIAEDDLQHILDNTTDIWDTVRNKCIFITGGTGFFGKWLLESFLYINKKLELNAHISVLTRNPKAFLSQYPFYIDESSVRFIKGDLSTFEFPSGTFQYIIHAATEADATLNQAQPLLMLHTITEGTKRILEFASAQPIESFLFTSSGAVYGKQPSCITHIREDESYKVDINNPDSAYAEGKRLAELYCSIYFSHYNLPVKIARCFAFVGPYLPLDKHFAIGNFILSALKKQDIIIKGDGSPFRSYLYASDLAIWLWTILIKGENNTPYNVGSDNDICIEDLAKTVNKVCGNSINIDIKTKRSGTTGVERYVPSTERCQKKLGLFETVHLDDAILKTINFHKKHFHKSI
ncbi:MAG: NAD(P)-dependent oxidoreductase [Segetibacter sp.]